jgi:hypothetical protein
VDYKVIVGDEVNSAPAISGAVLQKQNGGQNKEKILLNIYTFKKLCIKSNTKKADEVHDYFIKLEEALFETMTEETNELRHQLIQNSKETAVKIRSKEDKIIDQFPEDKMCIYIADIGVIDGVHLVKFGESNNLKQRVASHRNTFENFELVSAYEVFNSRKFEKMLKEVPEIKYRLKQTVVKDQNRQEIMFVDQRYTLEDLNKEIKSMIEKHCTLESCLADVDLQKSEIELRKAEIELRKIEEKTKQMVLELEMRKLQTNDTIQLTPREIPEITTPISREISLISHKNSKIYLLEVMKSYEQYEQATVRCNGFGNYNGFSKEFKIKIETFITQDFGLSPIKTMGKIYYLNLKFNGHTSFYKNCVYETFIREHVNIISQEIRYEKVPPGLYKYKTESELLFKKFCEYTKDMTPLFENKCPSGFTQLYKKEFIEMVCSICDIPAPSYSNKTIKYFNGVTLKEL